MSMVGVLEARNNLSRLIRRAKAGEEVIITSRDVPQVKLVPVEPEPEHGTGAAIVKWFKEQPQVTWRSGEEIDAALAAERESWE